MKIQLSDHFTYKRLLRFTIPSIAMMIFSSIYGIVDGIFVSNFVGKTPFAAVNLIMPFCMLFGALGFMIGTSGCALVSKYLGEGNREKANSIFSMLIYISISFGVVVSVIGIIFMRPVSIALGAEGEMIDYCVTYGRILIAGTAVFILQYEFQSFLIAAEMPNFGLVITVAAGVTNIVLDALFVGLFDWGLVGAALATLASMIVGGIIPLVYFFVSKKSILRLVKPSFDGKALLKTCTNGSSEMMTNLSMSVVNILYNFQLMKIAGEEGVAAYGVIMYVNFIFIGVFLGYSVGSAPLISYNLGSRNDAELKNIYKKSMVIISCCAVILTAAALLMSRLLASIFVGYDRELLDMTHRGIFLYSIAFLVMGYNIFGSSFFTALNNGIISAVISFLRTLLFQLAAILILPELLGIDGVWLSLLAAESLALIVTFIFISKMRPRYHY